MGKSAVAIDTTIILKHRPILDSILVNKIISYEGWNNDAIYIGYGHMRQQGENFDNFTISNGRELILKDLKANCKVFTNYNKDSLALGLLAYNIGAYSTGMKTIVNAINSNVSRNTLDSLWLELCYIGNTKYPNLLDRRKWELQFLNYKESEYANN